MSPSFPQTNVCYLAAHRGGWVPARLQVLRQPFSQVSGQFKLHLHGASEVRFQCQFQPAQAMTHLASYPNVSIPAIILQVDSDFHLPVHWNWATLLTMSPTVYIGIDSIPGSPPFALAALDGERRLVALSQGPLAEMVAYTAGQTEAVVAINAPPRPNQGLVARQDTLLELEKSPSLLRQHNLRLAEVILRQKGLAVPRTPADPAHCMGWMRRGFELHAQLQAMGYAAYPADAPRYWIETQANACFQTLLGVPPFTAGTLEGRLQRQLVLRDQHLPVPDPMDFFEEVTRHKLLHSILPTEKIHPQCELNALIAAQIAWLAANKPERLLSYGDPAEGIIYLPNLEIASKLE